MVSFITLNIMWLVLRKFSLFKDELLILSKSVERKN